MRTTYRWMFEVEFHERRRLVESLSHWCWSEWFSRPSKTSNPSSHILFPDSAGKSRKGLCRTILGRKAWLTQSWRQQQKLILRDQTRQPDGLEGASLLDSSATLGPKVAMFCPVSLRWMCHLTEKCWGKWLSWCVRGNIVNTCCHVGLSSEWYRRLLWSCGSLCCCRERNE